MADLGINVKIGIDAAAFEAGIKSISERMNSLEKMTARVAERMKAAGDRIQELGRKASIASAAVTAIGGGMFYMAKGAADSAREIKNLSRVSNASTREFQRMAAGASTVGVEQDKLADIFKDVNDRIGDFMSTGGGPMADFFEKIAPQVGVTADQFARLSGPEALQLYVSSLEKAGVSQQEMTFYLEAMASDATRLLPLLRDNGKAMTDLGDAAETSGRVMNDSAIDSATRFSAKLADLGGKLDAVKTRVGLALIEPMTNILSAVDQNGIPALHKLAGAIEDLIGWFDGLPGPIQEGLGVIATTLAVGGPVMIAIGVVIKALGSILAFMGPQGLIALAVVAGIVAWNQWGDDIKAAVGGALDYISTKFEGLLNWMQSVIDKAVAVKNAIKDALTIDAFGGQTPSAEGGGFSGEGADFRGLGSGSDGTGELGGNMGADIFGAGDMLSGGAGMDNLQGNIGNDMLANVSTKGPRDLGLDFGREFAAGITESTELVATAASSMGKKATEQTDASVGDVLSAMGELFQGSKKISAGIALANSWLAFTEVLKDPSYVGRPLARFAAASSALASGLNAVRSIKSAQAGGGGAGGGASTGGAAGGGVGQTIAIQYTGPDWARAPIDQTITGINDFLRRGGRLEGVQML